MTALIATYDLYAAVLLVIFAAVIAYIVYYYFKHPPKNSQNVENGEELYNNIEESEFEEPDILEIHGTVERKECFSAMNSSARNAHAYKTFMIYFKSDDGEDHEYSIEEETYLEIEEGDVGTVAIVGSRFYGYCSDKDSACEESDSVAE